MTDKELYALYMEKTGSIKESRYFHMSDDLYNGQNSYLRMKFKGSSFFNPIWIKKIEDCLYELDQITNSPREVTTQDGSVMPIELAKKINYESVQHLASHSQYIKDINEKGDVIPAKILGIFNREELHTYENRFIATFIRRLMLFIDKRYEFIKSTVSFDEKEVMYVKNKSMVDGQEVEIETKITVRRAIEDDLTESAREYVERIDKLKEYVGYYYNSPFMKEFKTEKDVRRPILLTNILRKNPLYHKCYETFLFIEKFDSLGVAFKVDKSFQKFTPKERKELSQILLSNLLFLENTEDKKSYKKAEKVYKPKLLSSIDDEVFTYGELVKGPIEYVRTDEGYVNYLQSLVKEDLPVRPNTGEKKYYQDEYKLKHDVQKEIKSIDDLLARTQRNIKKCEKQFEKLIAERKVEEAKLLEEELKKLKEQEKDYLEQKRAEIIAAAKGEVVTEPKKSKKKKAEEKPVEDAPVVLDEPKKEEQPQENAPVEEPVIEEPIIEEPVQEEVAPEEPVAEEPAPEVVEEPEPEPVPEPVEESQPEPEAEEPASEPETEEQPVEEPVLDEPQEEKVEETPVVEEAPVEEEIPVEEKPQEEKKEKAKKPRKPRKKAAKPAQKQENAPEQEPAREEEKEPEPVVEEPVPEEPQVEEPVKEEKPANVKKPRKTKAKKPEKKEEPKKKAPAKKPAPKKEKEKLEAIPGKFIVKTNDGYYVNQKRLSNAKSDAKIFDDFNAANEIKQKLGGKVVKLWAKN